MDFLELQSSRKRSAAFDHPISAVVVLIALTVSHPSYDMHRGKGDVPDGAAFSAACLGRADDFGQSPAPWSATRCGRGGSLVMPVFIAAVFSYTFLTFTTCDTHPWTTALRLGTLAYLSGRL